jgi:UPF0716 protein FxsA
MILPIEIYLFIAVGSTIGAFPTFFLIMLMMLAGVYLLHHQGIVTLRKLQLALARGEPPTDALLEGILLLIGGILLIIPGFFTDFIGLICLIPGLRNYLLTKLNSSIQTHSSSAKYSATLKKSTIIEGEYRREKD